MLIAQFRRRRYDASALRIALNRRLCLAASSLLLLAALVAGCGNDGDDVAPGDTPTAPVATPESQRTQEAEAASLAHLGNATLPQGDVPGDFTLRLSAPVTAAEAAAANVGIPRLASYLQNRGLRGAWASFYVREQPQSGLTSIVYEFETPEAAQAFIDAIAALTIADYPAASAVERVQSDKIEDKAQMMLYRLSNARSYDYTWAQGRLAGQIVLRYTSDSDIPEDRSLMLALARKQAESMRSVAQ